METEERCAWTEATYRKRQGKLWYRFLLNRRLSFAVKRLSGMRKGRLLDIGTGPGDSLEILKNRLGFKEAVGIDHNESFIRESLDCSIRFLHVDARKLPFDAGTFNCITAISCMKHVFDLDLALKEAWRVMLPDGMLIIIEPSYLVIKLAAWLGYFDLKNIANHLRATDYAAHLRQCGFSHIDSGHFLLGIYQFNTARGGI